jgi:hypothetical protein
VVERTFGWINRARRLSKDFEATIESALAWLQIAFALIFMKRLARAKSANGSFRAGLLGSYESSLINLDSFEIVFCRFVCRIALGKLCCEKI